jgi:hypothetical protein
LSYDDIPYLYRSRMQSRNIRAIMFHCHPECYEGSVVMDDEMLSRSEA